ncbi:intraflagellar transport protein 46 homolog, partial [Ctenocephalides felis]|uniref:intraflagellar transport protein 46 homolog n=1 Tax=Ctenocephalides felis TaxID=7515 RepID=UPI000E6E38E6
MYDEAIDVVNANEIETPPKSESPNPPRFIAGTTGLSMGEDDFKNVTKKSEKPLLNKNLTLGKASFNDENTSNESSVSSDLELKNRKDDIIKNIIRSGSDIALHASTPDYYDLNKFKDLQVSPDAKELFLHISRYTPQNIELEYRLKPFIPKLIPAVGDIDAMLKVVPPSPWIDTDGMPNNINVLGLEVLDEPSGTQSEPALLHMKLRASNTRSTPSSAGGPPVSLAKSNKDIEKWIRDIEALHATQPAPTLSYNKPAPDVDSLMQEWSGPVERVLDENGFPEPTLDCTLSQYVSIVCNLLDIPIPKPYGHKERLHALHTFFSLYA